MIDGAHPPGGDPGRTSEAEPAGRAHGPARLVETPESSHTEVLEGQIALQSRVVPRWIGCVIIATGIVMLPWVAGLAVFLPDRHEAADYGTSWVGFDLLLCAVLLRTGWLAWRGREHIELTAAMTGTLLVVDAWFDVMTSSNASEFRTALLLAIFAELPMAAFCLWIAGRVEFRRQERARIMGRLVRRLRHERRVSGVAEPPDAA
ncbi:hypothetical protein ACRYCC_33405 [Actinomadura scrupuli]|uniref:hypothetical protein n=1 Tax=Actinomadura scrupuli TaxID=559629 RepID=UPI003D9859DA